MVANRVNPAIGVYAEKFIISFRALLLLRLLTVAAMLLVSLCFEDNGEPGATLKDGKLLLPACKHTVRSSGIMVVVALYKTFVRSNVGVIFLSLGQIRVVSCAVDGFLSRPWQEPVARKMKRRERMPGQLVRKSIVERGGHQFGQRCESRG